MKVVSVLDALPPKDRHIAGATVRLRGAYEALGNGTPSKEDCAIILVDLASFSGYYNTTSGDMPSEQVKYSEGMRAVYGRIMRFMNMPLNELREYQQAVIDFQGQAGDRL